MKSNPRKKKSIIEPIHPQKGTFYQIPYARHYNPVKNIQAAAYNGARTVFGPEFISWDSISTPRIYNLHWLETPKLKSITQKQEG